MDKKVLFEALNTELAKENIDLEIILKIKKALHYGLFLISSKSPPVPLR